jgi:uncharacterized damage-inducible protein DinB
VRARRPRKLGPIAIAAIPQNAPGSGVEWNEDGIGRRSARRHRLEIMDLANHFQMLARYNRIANERLFAACARLDETEYRKPRNGSFGSIHGLLNHILSGDRIWMARFQGRGHQTPPLDTVLAESFSELRIERLAEDSRIEEFFAGQGEDFFSRSFPYTNNRGLDYVEDATVAVGHFFNHQTHHRGQVHVMLSQTQVQPPSLDLHRIVNP